MTPANPTTRRTYRFDLVQDGLVVASVEAPNHADALREIQHYALVYGQDGPVEIRARRVKR